VEGKDPIIRLRKYLTAKGLWNDEKQAALVEGQRASKVVVKTANIEKPAVDDIFDYTYATLTPELESRSGRCRSAYPRGAGGSTMRPSNPRQGPFMPRTDMIKKKASPSSTRSTRHSRRRWNATRALSAGRGRRRQRRRLPRHRRPAEALRPRPRHRHAPRRVRHHGHRHRPGHGGMPHPEIQFEGFLGPAYDQLVQPRRPLSHPHPRRDHHPDDGPRPVGRRHPRPRAPQRLARSDLRPHSPASRS
jgi:hypothetical protein